MFLIPAPFVVLSAAFAGLAWVLFARSQAGRFQAPALIWMCVPFMMVAGIYLWFSFDTVELEARAVHARISIMAISISQGLILLFLSIISRGRHATRP